MVAAVCVIADEIKPEASAQGGGAPIVKSTFEISKKIFPTASTFTRQVLLKFDGTAMVSVPSLAVAVANTVGNVRPPSVDNKIFTDAQLTGATVVPLTLHVTVADDPASHTMAAFGDVTANGPDAVLTVTATSVNAVWPIVTPGSYSRLSLTVNLKFNVLDTELSASIFVPGSPPANGGVTNRPARMVDNFGKVRVPETVGENDNQFGPVAFVGDATLLAPVVVELSFCSQQ